MSKNSGPSRGPPDVEEEDLYGASPPRRWRAPATSSARPDLTPTRPAPPPPTTDDAQHSRIQRSLRSRSREEWMAPIVTRAILTPTEQQDLQSEVRRLRDIVDARAYHREPEGFRCPDTGCGSIFAASEILDFQAHYQALHEKHCPFPNCGFTYHPSEGNRFRRHFHNAHEMQHCPWCPHLRFDRVTPEMLNVGNPLQVPFFFHLRTAHMHQIAELAAIGDDEVYKASFTLYHGNGGDSSMIADETVLQPAALDEYNSTSPHAYHFTDSPPFHHITPHAENDGIVRLTASGSGSSPASSSSQSQPPLQERTYPEGKGDGDIPPQSRLGTPDTDIFEEVAVGVGDEGFDELVQASIASFQNKKPSSRKASNRHGSSSRTPQKRMPSPNEASPDSDGGGDLTFMERELISEAVGSSMRSIQEQDRLARASIEAARASVKGIKDSHEQPSAHPPAESYAVAPAELPTEAPEMDLTWEEEDELARQQLAIEAVEKEASMLAATTTSQAEAPIPVTQVSATTKISPLRQQAKPKEAYKQTTKPSNKGPALPSKPTPDMVHYLDDSAAVTKTRQQGQEQRKQRKQQKRKKAKQEAISHRHRRQSSPLWEQEQPDAPAPKMSKTTRYYCSRCLRKAPISADNGMTAKAQIATHTDPTRSCRIRDAVGSIEIGLPNRSGWIPEKEVRRSVNLTGLRAHFRETYPEYQRTMYPLDPRHVNSSSWESDPNNPDNSKAWGLPWPPYEGSGPLPGGGNDDDDDDDDEDDDVDEEEEEEQEEEDGVDKGDDPVGDDPDEGLRPETRAGVEKEPELAPEKELQPDPEPEPEPEQESAKQSDQEPAKEPEPQPKPGPEADALTLFESFANFQLEKEPGHVSLTQPETFVLTQPRPVVSIQPEPVVLAQHEPAIPIQSESVVLAQPEPVVSTQSRSLILTQPQAIVSIQPQPLVLVQPEPVALAQSESIIFTQPEPVVLAQPQPIVSIQPEPPILAQPQPIVLAQPRFLVQTASLVETAPPSQSERELEVAAEPQIASQAAPETEREAVANEKEEEKETSGPYVGARSFTVPDESDSDSLSDNPPTDEGEPVAVSETQLVAGAFSIPDETESDEPSSLYSIEAGDHSYESTVLPSLSSPPIKERIGPSKPTLSQQEGKWALNNDRKKKVVWDTNQDPPLKDEHEPNDLQLIQSTETGARLASWPYREDKKPFGAPFPKKGTKRHSAATRSARSVPTSQASTSTYGIPKTHTVRPQPLGPLTSSSSSAPGSSRSSAAPGPLASLALGSASAPDPASGPVSGPGPALPRGQKRSAEALDLEDQDASQPWFPNQTFTNPDDSRDLHVDKKARFHSPPRSQQTVEVSVGADVGPVSNDGELRASEPRASSTLASASTSASASTDVVAAPPSLDPYHAVPTVDTLDTVYEEEEEEEEEEEGEVNYVPRKRHPFEGMTRQQIRDFSLLDQYREQPKRDKDRGGSQRVAEVDAKKKEKKKKKVTRAVVEEGPVPMEYVVPPSPYAHLPKVIPIPPSKKDESQGKDEGRDKMQDTAKGSSASRPTYSGNVYRLLVDHNVQTWDKRMASASRVETAEEQEARRKREIVEARQMREKRRRAFEQMIEEARLAEAEAGLELELPRESGLSEADDKALSDMQRILRVKFPLERPDGDKTTKTKATTTEGAEPTSSTALNTKRPRPTDSGDAGNGGRAEGQGEREGEKQKEKGEGQETEEGQEEEKGEDEEGPHKRRKLDDDDEASRRSSTRDPFATGPVTALGADVETQARRSSSQSASGRFVANPRTGDVVSRQRAQTGQQVQSQPRTQRRPMPQFFQRAQFSQPSQAWSSQPLHPRQEGPSIYEQVQAIEQAQRSQQAQTPTSQQVQPVQQAPPTEKAQAQAQAQETEAPKASQGLLGKLSDGLANYLVPKRNDDGKGDGDSSSTTKTAARLELNPLKNPLRKKKSPK